MTVTSVSTNQQLLRAQKDSKHIGIKYCCDNVKVSKHQMYSQRTHRKSGKIVISVITVYCSQCNRAYFYPGSLRNHMIMHCGKKSHKRNQYEYSTAISRHLKLHLKRHLGQKSNKCAQCDYSTNNVGHLKRHQIIHIKEKQTPSLHICLFRCKWLTQDNLTYDKNGLCPS